jgi:hypothetical protein
LQKPLQSRQRPTFTALPALSIMGWLSQGPMSRNRRKAISLLSHRIPREKEKCTPLTLMNSKESPKQFCLLHSLRAASWMRRPTPEFLLKDW